MWLTKTVPAGLLLCLIQFGPAAAQTPPPVPPLYSRDEIDIKLGVMQNELNTLKAVDPYSKADVDAKFEQLKAMQSWLPLAVSIFAALLAALALWRTTANRKVDRALATKNRDDDVTLVPKNRDDEVTAATKPAKRSSVAYGWFG